MSEEPKRWSQPFAALLGAFDAQIGFGLPSIGGKDSMSGTFNEIDVPPTLVSFAVDVAKEKDIITPELKKAGNKLVLFAAEKNEYDLPDYEAVMKMYDTVHELIGKGAVVSAYALDGKGLAAAVSRMAFGNRLGVTIDGLSAQMLFEPGFGSIVAEVPESFLPIIMEAGGKIVGEVNDAKQFIYGNMVLSMDEALEAWTKTLEPVFKTRATENKELVTSGIYQAKDIYICKNRVAKPAVFIPVFPGTNCEYDSAKAFERAGAKTIVKVFKNLDAADIRDSVREFEEAIAQSQMIMFPGGFSAGDEPEGSAKFFATAFRNAKLTEAVNRLLDREECHVFLEVICGIIRYIATYVKAQIVIMGTIALIAAAVLGVSGVRHGVMWGVLAGILDALPFIGTGIVLVPLAIQQLFYGQYVRAALCLLTYVVCIFVRELLEPRLIGKRVGVSPIAILLSIYAGIKLFGAWGIIGGPLGFIIIYHAYISLERRKQNTCEEKTNSFANNDAI